MTELVLLYITKSNGVREPLNEEITQRVLNALKSGRLSSTIRNSYQPYQILAACSRRAEVPSKMIGNLVMDALKELNKATYICFASIYCSFENIR